MTPAQVASLRANFSENEAYVIAAVMRFGAPVAVAGPELLGEGPFGLPKEGRFFQVRLLYCIEIKRHSVGALSYLCRLTVTIKRKC